MTHLNTRDWILFLSSIALGVAGGLWNLYVLVLLSLIILFVALSTSPGLRQHEMSFLFPLSFLSCLPINLRLSWIMAKTVDLSYYSTIQRVFYMMLFILALISAEELILGVIGVTTWGDQKTIFYETEYQEQAKMEGYYLQEITENESCNQGK